MGTSIKKKVYISATAPATKNLAGYDALTWTQIKGVVSVGQIGFNHDSIEIPELETGITKTAKGARKGQGGEVSYAIVASDAGQAAVVAANEAETEVSLLILDPGGATGTCWTGIIMSLNDTESSTTSYEGQTFTFVPNYAKVTGSITP